MVLEIEFATDNRFVIHRSNRTRPFPEFGLQFI